MKKRDFISQGYAHGSGGEDAPSFYDAWASDYDADTQAEGYITPWRCADALRSVCPDINGPIADLGCGSGVSGEAFVSRDFGPIDGYDFSQSMLDVARSKGCYRDLFAVDLSSAGAVPANTYKIAALLGVLHPDHAPPSILEHTLNLLPDGGHLVFYMNERVASIPAYQDQIAEMEASRLVMKVFWELGPHLPGRGIEAVVGVMRKLK